MRFFKQTTSANIISIGGPLKKTASDNHVSTCGFLSKPPVLMLFPLAVCYKTGSANHVSTCGFLSKPPVLMLFTQTTASEKCRFLMTPSTDGTEKR
jgi:hypothetical protein